MHRYALFKWSLSKGEFAMHLTPTRIIKAKGTRAQWQNQYSLGIHVIWYHTSISNLGQNQMSFVTRIPRYFTCQIFRHCRMILSPQMILIYIYTILRRCLKVQYQSINQSNTFFGYAYQEPMSNATTTRQQCEITSMIIVEVSWWHPTVIWFVRSFKRPFIAQTLCRVKKQTNTYSSIRTLVSWAPVH